MFAIYDEHAIRYSDLRPAFGEERFFFQDELDSMLQHGETDGEPDC